VAVDAEGREIDAMRGIGRWDGYGYGQTETERIDREEYRLEIR